MGQEEVQEERWADLRENRVLQKGVEACTVQAKETAKQVTSAADASQADPEMKEQRAARENRCKKWREVCSEDEVKSSKPKRIQVYSNKGSRDDDQQGVRASTGRSEQVLEVGTV